MVGSLCVLSLELRLLRKRYRDALQTGNGLYAAGTQWMVLANFEEITVKLLSELENSNALHQYVLLLLPSTVMKQWRW